MAKILPVASLVTLVLSMALWARSYKTGDRVVPYLSDLHMVAIVSTRGMVSLSFTSYSALPYQYHVTNPFAVFWHHYPPEHLLIMWNGNVGFHTLSRTTRLMAPSGILVTIDFHEWAVPYYAFIAFFAVLQLIWIGRIIAGHWNTKGQPRRFDPLLQHP